jgi:hypothetical protein
MFDFDFDLPEINNFDLDNCNCVHRCQTPSGQGLFVEAETEDHLNAGFSNAVPLPGEEMTWMGNGKIAPAQDWV